MSPNRIPRCRSDESRNSTHSGHGERRGVFGTAMENVVIRENIDGFDSGDRDTSNLSILSSESRIEEFRGVELLNKNPWVSPKRKKSISHDMEFSPSQGNVDAKGGMTRKGSSKYNRDLLYDIHDPTLSTTPSHYKNFHSKLVTKQVRHMLYEICNDGTVTLRELSSRELCSYINECVDARVDRTVAEREVAVADNDAAAIGETTITPIPALSPTSYRSRQQSFHELVGWKDNNGQHSAATNYQIRKPSPGIPIYKSSFKLHHRDLRVLLTENHSSEPCVAVRHGVVLIHMESIRAIVLRNRIFLVVDDGADSILSEVERQMAVISLYERSPDFELRAYESIMDISMSHLMVEVKHIEPEVKAIVHLMESIETQAATSAEYNNQFRSLMNDVNELLSRTRARQRAISSILDEDADLALMHLTKMSEQPELYTLPLDSNILEKHDDVEILFENSLQDANSLVNVLEITKDRMCNTQALIMVKLDIARNRLLTADTIFGMVAMCSSFGALFSGIMGMNLESGWDFTNWSFFITIFFIIGFSVVIGSIVFIRMQRDGIWVR